VIGNVGDNEMDAEEAAGPGLIGFDASVQKEWMPRREGECVSAMEGD